MTLELTLRNNAPERTSLARTLIFANVISVQQTNFSTNQLRKLHAALIPGWPVVSIDDKTIKTFAGSSKS